jgi:hypothetical protein
MRKFTITMVAPVGRLRTKEAEMPMITDTMPHSDDTTMVFRKLRAICSAVTGGRMRRDEVSIIPTIFMARTTVIPVKRTRMAFIFPVSIPDIRANSSSKAVEKCSW